jgi:LmbE family N-acetylglucosaminyl deacetylase
VFQLPLTSGGRDLRHVLALGCHADDVEIGCGATLIALTRSVPDARVTLVVFSADGPRADEARASAASLLVSAKSSDVIVHGFRDGFFPYIGSDVKEVFEDLKSRLDPDVVFTHSRHDLHQDHRLVCELTWNTFRDHLILEYEIPKYDGDLGTPNVFVPIPADVARDKVRLITEAFASQRPKDWFDEELFLGLMRVRGMEVRSPTGYAEAFTCRKLSLVTA